MTNKLKISFLFCVFLVLLNATSFKAQIKSGDYVDGVVAVIGDEVILESDVEEQKNYGKQQGAAGMSNCEFLESLLNNKLLVYEAKRDTIIEDRTSLIKENAGKKYDQILSQFPDENTMLAAYKFRTPFEMKTAIEKIDIDNYYGQAKMQRITDKLDVTPNEVTDFYNLYKNQLPQVNDEVMLAQILIYPKLTEAHKKELADKLKKIKQDILNGESFESQARIYSEDPGSASKGGLYVNVPKGQMVKPFEAAALTLQEGEISEPVESEFGFHLIQLVKKSGRNYDARHILLMAKPTEDEIKTAKNKLDSISVLISSGKMTFKEAAFKFSEDKATKYNAGIMTTGGSDKIEKSSLSATMAYQVAGLNKGDMTEVFEDEIAEKKLVRLIRLEDTIPAHKLSFETDYARIKNLALNAKSNEVLEKWVKAKIPDVFIQISDKYKDCHFKSNWKK